MSKLFKKAEDRSLKNMFVPTHNTQSSRNLKMHETKETVLQDPKLTESDQKMNKLNSSTAFDVNVGKLTANNLQFSSGFASKYQSKL